MSEKQMFAVLRHKEIEPKDWKVQGPGEKAYKVIEHTRENVPSTMDSGTITFVVQVGEDEANKQTLVATVTPGAKDTVTKDGVELPEANVDGGVAGGIVFRGFRPKFRGSVIIKFFYVDDEEDDGIGEWRFEGKFGTIGLPALG